MVSNDPEELIPPRLHSECRDPNRGVPRNSEPGMNIPRESEARKAFFSAILCDSEFRKAPSPGFLVNQRDLKSVFSGKLCNPHVLLVIAQSMRDICTPSCYKCDSTSYIWKIDSPFKPRDIMAPFYHHPGFLCKRKGPFSPREQSVQSKRAIFHPKRDFYAPKTGHSCTEGAEYPLYTVPCD